MITLTVVAFNGVFNFTTALPDHAQTAVTTFLGDSSLAKDASPFWRATPDTALTLVLHGNADTTVPYEQSAAYQRRLNELGVCCDLHTEPGAGHGFFNRSPHYEHTVSIMERFLTDVLGLQR